MAAKQTKSPTFAVMPYRPGPGRWQDIFFYFVQRIYGELHIDEVLVEKIESTACKVEDRDAIIRLLTKAGITVRYYDPEEKKWMDQSESGGLEPAPGDRDGGWVQPNLESFKEEYLGHRFGASAAA
jgi:hypothetical protein